MKVLAIDYGTKNIGLALSDDEQKFAFPYRTLKVKFQKPNVKGAEKIIEDIGKICKSEKVKKIIVGMPINLSGEETKTTKMVFNFIKKLGQYLDIPIETEDERLTTVQALRIKDKGFHNVHELAAQILLQNWLDKN